MTLLQMSLTGGLLIAVTALLRAAVGGRLPRKTYLALWAVALFCLLVPLRLPWRVSEQTPVLSETAELWSALETGTKTAITARLPEAEPTASTPEVPWLLLWCLGAALTAGYYALRLVRGRRILRQALPLTEGPAAELWKALRGRTRARLFVSDRIRTPLTEGPLFSRVYLPRGLEAGPEETLTFVLTHELVHVRRLDLLVQWFALAARCIHWWNPSVWLLPRLLRQDLELSCDETVLRILGTEHRAAYACSLLDLAEFESNPAPVLTTFGEEPIKERIVNIMKWKKPTIVAILCGISLAVLLTAIFLLKPETAVDTWGKYTVFVSSRPVIVLSQDERVTCDTYELPDGTQYEITVPSHAFAENHGFLINEYGETFGPELETTDEEGNLIPVTPDLVSCFGVKRAYGYVKVSECRKWPSSPDETIPYSEKSYTVNLYLEDGKTVIGQMKNPYWNSGR